MSLPTDPTVPTIVVSPTQQVIDLEVAQFNLTLTIDMVKYAEGKATALLAYSAALIGVALTEVPEASEVILKIAEESNQLLAWLLVALHFTFYALMSLSVYFAMQAVRPKLIPKSEKHSWFFFQSMSLLTSADYHEFCKALTSESLLDQLCDQIYNNSNVARRKFDEVIWSLYFAISGSIAAVVAVLPILVIKGIIGGAESTS